MVVICPCFLEDKDVPNFSNSRSYKAPSAVLSPSSLRYIFSNAALIRSLALSPCIIFVPNINMLVAVLIKLPKIEKGLNKTPSRFFSSQSLLNTLGSAAVITSDGIEDR